MMGAGTLLFDKKQFELEETTIYGIYEPHGDMTWHIELFPQGEENYIMLNAIVFKDTYSPAALSNIQYNAASNYDDLYEHTVLVNGEERHLQTLNMVFGNWQAATQSIPLTGKGIIEPDDTLPALVFKFDCILHFKDLNIFETTAAATQEFVDNHLQEIKSRLLITFEKVASGLQAVISGQF